ncbi:MAG TPA: hypothetical protein VN577_09785 [Terriglobales bacterium]|nr:hypothetical protein [Terriglobales bacterium]
MATSPHLPEERPTPTLAEQKRKKSASPLVPLGLLAAALLLAAILYFMPRTPKAGMPPNNAAVPAQPTGDQVQISGTRISEAPTGGQLYIYATVHNAGTTAITGLLTNVIFTDQNGTSLQVQGVAEGIKDGKGVNLVDTPIAPGQNGNIRIPVQHVPQGWNHQPPDIQIAQVTAAGGK